MLFGIAIREADTQAQVLVDANRDLRGLLADIEVALDGFLDERADAAGKVFAALPAPAADLRLTSLRAEFDGLREAFCGLASLIEPAAADPALAPLAPLRERAYAWFSNDARRRSFPLLNN